MMLPSAAKMMTAIGTTPEMNSLKIAQPEVSRCSGGMGGPSSGLMRQRTIV